MNATNTGNGSAEERRTTVSYCRVCPAACGIIVETVGQQVIRVTGDPDHPLTKGYTCSKGRAAPAMHHHANRLDRPMMRTADGHLHPVSWEVALDDIADRLRTLLGQHGPAAVAQYVGSSGYDSANAVTHGFLTGLGSRNAFTPMTIDATTTWWVGELMFGHGFPWPLCPDYINAELLMIIGHNPVVSHGHSHRFDNPRVSLRNVRARGGKVVVVDPRVTETARLADIHVQLRPGSDPALLAFLVNQALTHRPDHQFLDLANAASLETLRQLVMPYTCERAAAICDLDPDVLDRVWQLVETTPRIAMGSGTGVSMNAAGNAIEWLSLALLTITGSIDRQGGTIVGPGVIAARERKQVRDIPYEKHFETLGSGRRVPRIQGSLPCAALPDEIAAGSIRALFSVGGNPAVVFPETGRTLAALENLDLLVSIDVRETETTKLSTHVLPTTFQFERADVNPSYLSADAFAQYTVAVVEPVAERRPMWWIYNELSRRLNVPLFGSPQVDAMLGGTITDDDAVIDLLMARSRIPMASVRAAPHGVIDEAAPEPGWLIPDLLSRPIDLAPASIVEHFAGWEGKLPKPGELVLICRRLPRQVNSMMHEIDVQVSRGPYPTLLVHPDDATPRGLGDGDPVQVTSAYGSVSAVAECSDSIRAGAVSLTHAWDSPNINALTSYSDVDPVTLMPRFTGLPVTVTRIDVAEPRADALWQYRPSRVATESQGTGFDSRQAPLSIS